MPKDQHVEAIIKEIEATGVHMRVYFLDTKTNDAWEARKGGANEPGKTTPADASIEFDPARWDALKMDFEGQKTVSEIRIIAYYAKPDDEEKFYYAGALSGKLGTPGSTYGTIWVHGDFRAGKPNTFGTELEPYTLSMAFHEIFELLAEQRGSTTLHTDPHTDAGKASATTNGFSPHDTDGTKDWEKNVETRQTWETQKRNFAHAMKKKNRTLTFRKEEAAGKAKAPPKILKKFGQDIPHPA